MSEFDYTARIETVGDWNGDEESVVERWNTYIMPVFDGTIDPENPEHPAISIGHGRAAYANEWAWEEFCGGAGDSDEAAEKLAKTLAAKLAE